MLRLSPSLLLSTRAWAALDEASMLQMPAVAQGLSADFDASDCRCPAYYKEECEAEWAQGCVWTDLGSSNAPWCQCGPVPTDPLTGEPVTVPPPVAPTVLPSISPTISPTFSPTVLPTAPATLTTTIEETTTLVPATESTTTLAPATESTTTLAPATESTTTLAPATESTTTLAPVTESTTTSALSTEVPPASTPYPDAVIAVSGPLVSVLIDNSDENTKCVTVPFPVICANDSGHFGNRLNSHTAGDTFEITVDGTEVCATRTDASHGWVMHLEIACAAAPVHILIDSSSTNTKCVRHSFPVTCAGDAGHPENHINSHQYGDTFDITTSVDTMGPKICATRTDIDYDGGWGMHLEIACVAANEEELQGQIVAAPALNILIGDSNENTKCVQASQPVICASDAGHLGNRVNTHTAGDAFEITTDGTQVCAQRTDAPHGWDMHLEITCVAAPVHIFIGGSGENTKCVTASYPVTCADDAGHLWNRVNTHQYGDTFEISSNGVEVCATRTDQPGGWGMQLEIVCVATGEVLPAPVDE